MKPVDMIILAIVLTIVGIVLYKKIKQIHDNKKQGIIGCGGSCSGCSGCGDRSAKTKLKHKQGPSVF